jgi:hypothetical protein
MQFFIGDKTWFLGLFYALFGSPKFSKEFSKKYVQ